MSRHGSVFKGPRPSLPGLAIAFRPRIATDQFWTFSERLGQQGASEGLTLQKS